MIILAATNEKLQMVLAGAITSNNLQFSASYVDVTTTTYTPGASTGVSNNTTDADMVGVPGGSTQRQIKLVAIYNADTVDATVTIKKDVGGTDTILCKVLINSGDTLQYTDGEGFAVMSSVGGKKTSPAPAMGISAGTQSVSTGNVVFSNSNGLSFGLSGSSRVTGSFSRLSMSFFELLPAELNPNAAATNSASLNLSLQRVFIPYDITATRLDVIANLTVAASTNGTWSISAGVYTRAASTLNSASSTNSGVVFGSGGATTDANSYSGISGTRIRSLSAANWAFTPGEYWFGFMNSVQGPAGTTGSVTIYGQSSNPIQGLPGANNDVMGLAGLYNQATGAFPTAIQYSEIIFATTGAATASNLMRQPYFRLYGTY